jgi:uncharacterized protein YceK
MKFISGIICAASFVMISGCATTGENAAALPGNHHSYATQQYNATTTSNASTTAAKMISPVTQ